MSKIVSNSLDSNLLEKIIYSSFRKAWEEDHQFSKLSYNVICVTEVSQCLLKSWFSRTLRAPPSENKVILMVLGDSTHYLMKDYFPLGEGEKFHEKDIGNGVKLVGRVDRLLEDCIIEFKTVSRLPNEPYEIHVNQTQLYLWLFEKEKAFIVYVSRSNGKVKIFEVYKDDEKISELLERARLFANYLKEGRMPPRERNNLCNYCEYKQLCDQIYGEK